MKKKKTIIISVVVIILILILVGAIISKTKNIRSEKNSVNDFGNIKELVEYYDCQYISTKNSTEENFKKDINLVFPEDPISESGANNQYLYNSIISGMATKMDNKNFRVIDETRDITIRVYFIEDGRVTYTVNGDDNYFAHMESNYTMSNELVENITHIQANSNILVQIVNNNWKTTNLNLGTIDSIVNKYDIYFYEGYKIRKVNGKVYNLVFTSKYNMPVVNNLKPDANLEEVQNVLGTPTYNNNLETGEKLIGYKTDYFYIFFPGDEISIYPNQEADKQDEFAQLVTKYIEDKNPQEFLSKLTDIWPDYSDYISEASYVNIKYPLRGIEIQFNDAIGGTIQIYNNYNGRITNDTTVADIKNNKNLPKYVNMSLNENLVNRAEVYRIQNDSRSRQPWDQTETILTEKYAVFLYADENRCDFYSTDKQNIDSTLEDNGLNNIYKLNEEIFIYSVQGKGIYAYNASTTEKREIVSGSDTFKVNKVENNIIYYDNKQIAIN